MQRVDDIFRQQTEADQPLDVALLVIRIQPLHACDTVMTGILTFDWEGFACSTSR